MSLHRVSPAWSRRSDRPAQAGDHGLSARWTRPERATVAPLRALAARSWSQTRTVGRFLFTRPVVSRVSWSCSGNYLLWLFLRPIRDYLPDSIYHPASDHKRLSCQVTPLNFWCDLWLPPINSLQHCSSCLSLPTIERDWFNTLLKDFYSNLKGIKMSKSARSISLPDRAGINIDRAREGKYF